MPYNPDGTSTVTPSPPPTHTATTPQKGTSVQPTYQQITTKKSANHGLHLVLTLLTCGLWSPVWLIVAMVGRKETSTLQGFTGQPQQVYPPQQYGQPQAWPQQQYGQQPPSALPPAQQQQPYPPKPEKSPLDGNA